MRYCKFIAFGLVLCALSCGNASQKDSDSQHKSYECDLFSVDIPEGYYCKEAYNGLGPNELIIGKDSLAPEKTIIMWSSENIFPGTAEQFVSVITSQEIESFESSNSFYDVMTTDSTFVIDGFPTFTISSIYTENGDTIIQSRTGIVRPNEFYMMITQKCKANKSEQELRLMFDIPSSIKFK